MRRCLPGAMAGLAIAALGCNGDPTLPRSEFVPEMVDSVPYDSFAANPATRDGKTLIAPAPGTIARGHMPLRYGPAKEEAERAGREMKNPFAGSPETLARGATVFNTWCVPCHGAGGKGDGPVIPKFPTPPSLLAPNARKLPDGRIFHILTFGQGLMPSYAQQLAPEDRWKAVLHVRTLQRSAPGSQTGGAAQ